MNALGYAQFDGRREGLADTYAPWLRRIASLELARKNKIDNAKTYGMARYLYVDVRVSDVGGSSYVRHVTKPLAYYVDDGSSGCTNGTNSAGPGGTPYDCVGGQVTIAK